MMMPAHTYAWKKNQTPIAVKFSYTSSEPVAENKCIIKFVALWILISLDVQTKKRINLDSAELKSGGKIIISSNCMFAMKNCILCRLMNSLKV